LKRLFSQGLLRMEDYWYERREKRERDGGREIERERG